MGASFPAHRPLPSLRWTGWICLIIGLMLLAAVHGLRLGALVQLLTFGGFILGFLLGILVWVPLLKTGHESRDPGRRSSCCWS